jgi:hypothetical protein
MLIGVTGCSIVPQRYRLAAEPLKEITDLPVTQVIAQPPSGVADISASTSYTAPLTNIQRVSLLVQDSQTKCAQFVDSMFAETAGAGFILDILSTGTSALATVFTPLTTVHSLTASSTIFGAAKTGISANYLNTLSTSHITQAIQSTYTADMRKYIASLDTADPTKLDVFQERSKIVSYHNECSLAAAEGSISSALQPAAQTGQGLKYTHTVKASENSTNVLAQAIVNEINNDPDFSKAGITALLTSNSIITLKNPNSVQLTVTSSPASLIQYVQGTGVLTIVGTPIPGNTITITGPSATQQTSGNTQPSANAQPSGGSQTAPAAVSGQNPALK